MSRKRIFSLMISVLLLLTAVSPGLFVHAADSVSVTFLFTDGTEIYPFFDLQVTDGAAETYGFTPAEKDHADKPVQTVTALDALVTAHAVFYGDAFTSRTAGDYIALSYGFASKAFTQSGSFGFSLNDATPHDDVLVTSDWGSYYTGYALDTTRLQNGDVITLYKYVDGTGWSDVYPTFDKRDLTVTANEAFTVCATGYGIMSYGSCEQSVIDANTIPMAGAQLYLTQDFKTYTPAGTLDKTGAASVTAKQAGTWYLIVRGTVNGSPVIPNICKLTVQENPADNARWFPIGLRPILRWSARTLTLGMTVRLRDLRKNAPDCSRTYAVQFCFDGTTSPIRFLREV